MGKVPGKTRNHHGRTYARHTASSGFTGRITCTAKGVNQQLFQPRRRKFRWSSCCCPYCSILYPHRHFASSRTWWNSLSFPRPFEIGSNAASCTAIKNFLAVFEVIFFRMPNNPDFTNQRVLTHNFYIRNMCTVRKNTVRS